MVHIPVLLKEVIEILALKPGYFIIDATVGEGGHSVAISEKIFPAGILLAMDLDREILKAAAAKLKPQNLKVKIILLNGNYAELPRILKEKNLEKADGLLLDLGFSSFHLKRSNRVSDQSNKGFSFSFDEEPLIMTYADKQLSAKEFLKRVSEKKLRKIIKEYGEEKNCQKIARAIKQSKKPIETNKDLREIIEAVVKRKGRLHPATKTFMALRIYLNKELENLEKILDCLHFVLKPGARAAIISFHSLEDKIVKRKFKELENMDLLKILTKKPIKPSQREIELNPKARSAKLRAAEIINNH